MSKTRLARLASKIANNHVNLSMPHSIFGNPHEKILKKPLDSINEKVVLLIGAGASYDCAGLPLAQEAAEILKERMKHIDNKLYENELESLSSVYRLNEEEFETKLLALSKFDPSTLIDELFNLFYRKYYPSAAYEIIAHMLKHRFVDAVINFNFDELLDQSIEDELGDGDYYRIVSDGDCPENIKNIMGPDGRFDLPLYIKPHGTTSHRSTMRFTRRDYFGLPSAIQDVLKALFSKIPVTLVAIGHGMQSFEINAMLEKYLLDDSELYYINVSAIGFYGKLKQLSRKGFIQVSKSDSKSLDSVLKELWANISRSFKEEYLPRCISRHMLIPEIFTNKVILDTPESERNDENISYLKDRTFVEMAISIAKSKGFVTLSELASNRTGKYYGLYKKMAGEKARSFKAFYEGMNLIPTDYSQEALRYKGLEKPISEGDLIIDEDTFKSESVTDIVSNLINMVSRPTQSKIRSLQLSVVSTLNKHYADSEVEICPKYKGIYEYSFKNPIVYSTYSAIQYHTHQLLSTDWDALLIIAESGQWLLNPDVAKLIKRQERKILLIVADSNYTDKIQEVYEGYLSLEIKLLPWWLHNQHMTLFMRKKIIKTIIYFTRRMRISLTNPIQVKDPDELQSLCRTFFAYWLKSERIMSHRKNVYISDSDIEEVEEKLLDILYSKKNNI